MKNKFLKWQLVITLFIFVLVIIYFYNSENKNLNKYTDILSFNNSSGFYNKSIDIKIKKSFSLPFGTKLYYTLNGNNPTNKSDVYNGKITLSIDEEGTKVYPLRVVAYFNGSYSEIYNETYVLDKNINDNDIMLVSIASDEENLYDYNKGILVKGAQENYYQRGDEWLRDAYISIFDKNGENLLSQNILLGVSGGSYSSENPKSFKIKALDNEKLNLNFYDEDYHASFSLINNNNSLRLRSGSQDFKTGNIRSGIISQLASDSNFDGASISQRAVVFLNGQFYGIHDFEQNYSNSFLAKKYSLPNSDLIEKYKGMDTTTTMESGIVQYFYNDLNIENNRKELEKYVDMDNYLLYYAIEILANNIDWPNHNFEIWRYTGEYNPNNKYTDGRYRFLIYDVDAIFSGDIHIGNLGDDYRDVLMLIMNNMYNQKNTSFVQVMKSTYYRDKFVRIVEDLLNTSFSKENMKKIADEEADKIYKSVLNYYTEEEKENFLYHLEYIKENMINRHKEIETDFTKLFNFKDKHKISISSTKGIKIYWDNMEVFQNEKYENEYYNDIKLSFNYEEYPGYKFQYWLVNGQKIYDNTLIIDSKYKKEDVEIEVVSSYVNDANHLIISEIYSNGSYDWIKLTNSGQKNIKLQNYFISDNLNKLDKYRLPDVTLKKYESIIINGSKNYYALGDYISNFNLKEYEYLYLSYNNEICDSLQVPRASSVETYGRVDNSNTYNFFINYNNSRKTN